MRCKVEDCYLQHCCAWRYSFIEFRVMLLENLRRRLNRTKYQRFTINREERVNWTCHVTFEFWNRTACSNAPVALLFCRWMPSDCVISVFLLFRWIAEYRHLHIHAFGFQTSQREATVLDFNMNPFPKLLSVVKHTEFPDVCETVSQYMVTDGQTRRC
jgi:hypothetical protein